MRAKCTGISLGACVRPDAVFAWIGSRCNKDYGKDTCYPHYLLLNIFFCGRADHRHPKIRRGNSHPRRAGAPEGTADVDGTGIANGLGSSCGGGHAGGGRRLNRFYDVLAKMMEVIVGG